MSLTPAFLDELRARTLLSALIGKSVKLQRAGREWRACCPFHNEKTPSFYVNDDKGFYHCFGCSAHGDAIRWMTDQRGLTFIDAVKELAQAAGMEMPEQDRRNVERAEHAKGLHEAMADAAKWFVERLQAIEGAEARAVLERRGIRPETARDFGMGFSPDSRGKLKDALKTYGNPMLVEAGLLIEVEGKEPYDRFRGRLMIPIRDPRGRVIAFGGRVIGEGEPKYLNSPDTPLFDKGRTLYNLDRAQAAARKAGRVIAVEGYLDVIALAQAGFHEVVAPLGTALTEQQLERLWRLSNTPILCFDGDSAGQKAAIRAAHRALPILQPGQSLKVVVLPVGQDPDDVVRAEGPAAFEKFLTAAQPLDHALYGATRASADTTTPEGRAGLRADLQVLANTISHPFVRSEYGRAFNASFFEEFGWKRDQRQKIGSAILKTGPHGDRGALRMMLRSALHGLSRFPIVLALSYETLCNVQIANDDLLRWREVLVEAVIKRQNLDTGAIQAILASERLGKTDRQDLCFDLRFPWVIDPDVAQERLTGLINILATNQYIDAHMAQLNAELEADSLLAKYDTIEAKRKILREKREDLRERGYQLGIIENDDELG